LIADVFSIDTPVEHSAEALVKRYGLGPVPTGVGGLLEDIGSAERARAVADEVARRFPDSLCSLTLAAEVARLVDKAADRAGELLGQARAAATDPGDLAGLADHYLGLGRLAEVFDLVMPRLAEAPKDACAQRVYATALEEAHERALAVAAGPDGPGGPGGPDCVPDTCPCRSGRDWSDCCRLGEQAALDRFGARQALHTLREAIAGYVERAPFAATVDSWVGEWVAKFEDASDVSIDGMEGLDRLMAENAWIAVDTGSDGAGGHAGADTGDDADSDDRTPLHVSSAIRRLRRSWRRPAGSGSTMGRTGCGRSTAPRRGPGSGALTS
jgi:hypothetical protein